MNTMKYRRLDSNGDYLFGGGIIDFAQDIYAIAQAIKTKLALLKGEWWENLDEGLPLFQSILGAPGGQKSSIDLLYQQRILSVPNVKNIEQVQSSLENRIYSFYCVINTTFGKLTLLNVPNTSGRSSGLILVDESNNFILVDEDSGVRITS
jgi:hypothetical protein